MQAVLWCMSSVACVMGLILCCLCPHLFCVWTEVRKRKVSKQQAKSDINKLVDRLQGLKRKLEGWHQQADADFEVWAGLCAQWK